MGKDFTATGDVVRAGVKESGVEMPKAADKVLANVESITRTGDKVVITNKDSMRTMGDSLKWYIYLSTILVLWRVHR